MSEDSFYKLSDSDRDRILEELRSELATQREWYEAAKRETRFGNVLSYLSNGFVLLLVGALITSYLVPRFQRQYEENKQDVSLMRECLSQFLLYGNSIWSEYYLIFPLCQNSDIEKDAYKKCIGEISKIKLQRYDAFSKLEAIAVVFRQKAAKDEASEVENLLESYAGQVNGISRKISTWLKHLYCATPKRCDVESVDPDFDPYESFLKIEPRLQKLRNDEKEISQLMVKRINSAN